MTEVEYRTVLMDRTDLRATLADMERSLNNLRDASDADRRRTSVIPDGFPQLAPVAHLDIESTNRVDAEQWRQSYMQAQADMAAMEHAHRVQMAEMKHEHRRNCFAMVVAASLICLAIPARLVTNLITSLFGA